MTVRIFRQFFVLQYRRTHIAVPCLLRISKKTKVGTYRVVGIQLVAGIQAVERLFLAPTALANHWVQIQTVPSTKAKVTHQALTTSQLEQKFTQLLDQTLALPVVPLAAQAAPVQPAAAGTAARFCVNCGSPLKPDARFCKECGTKVT